MREGAPIILKAACGGDHTRDGIHFDAAACRTVFESLKQYV